MSDCQHPLLQQTYSLVRSRNMKVTDDQATRIKGRGWLMWRMILLRERGGIRGKRTTLPRKDKELEERSQVHM